MLDEPRTDLSSRAAGFWRRFGASLIDGILLGIVSTVFQFLLGRGFGFLLGFIAAGCYFAYFHGVRGQTPGNAALGIRVVDIGDGSVIGSGRAVGRWLISYVSALVLLVGYLWMLWDPQKQTWHDKAVRALPIHVGY